MTSITDLLQKVEQFKGLLVKRATGQSDPNDEEVFSSLRQELLAESRIRALLPEWVQHYRTLSEFWGFIKPQFSAYAERREFLRSEFTPLLATIEAAILDPSQLLSPLAKIEGTDLFKHQFPAGLPFGIKKPNLAFTPNQGTQTASFEDDHDIGVIRENVYPNLTYQVLDGLLTGKPIIRSDLATALYKAIQTPHEQTFFAQYARLYQIRTHMVPVLIPQAWIQWHSQTKQNLRSSLSSYADDLYRVDFVVFWKNARFALLIDDIGHYAKQDSKYWRADEELYSKRLKEDRKLRKEGWAVFRISNWEVRMGQALPEILKDLREFIDF